MIALYRHVVIRVAAILRPLFLALLSAAALAAPARAAVEIRVEGRPDSKPVEAYVKVTDDNGVPVSGLDWTNFRVFVDGSEIAIASGDVTLPPAQGGSQRVSVVFVMDFSGSVQQSSLPVLRTAVKDFINNALRVGDQAAILKFNGTLGPAVVQEFVEIDGAGNPNNLLLEKAVDDPYDGIGSPILDALTLGLNHIATPPQPLPAGPKAIIMVTDGGENASAATETEVVALANTNSIPIFTIGVGDTTRPGRTELLQGLGEETGGLYYPPEPDDTHIAAAYASIAELLSNEYLITFEDGMTDCAQHTLEVRVTNQAPVTVSYTRRACDTEPDPFSFDAQTNVTPDRNIRSNAVTVTGIEAPAHISVIQGAYSIDCNDTFTRDPGEISAGQTVCVRHQSSTAFSTATTTTLTIGGVVATFTSTTRAEGGGGGGGGGGAAGGLFELLLGLCLLLLGRQRLA